MSAGKNPYHRYQIINECFTNKLKPDWTKLELIDKLNRYDFNVSTRTIDLDIENMRHCERLKFFAPIEYCWKKRAFHYTDPNYSINGVQLSDEQLQAVYSVVHLLQPYKDSRILCEFEGAIEKIVRVVDQLRRQKPASSKPVIEFEKAPYYKGMVHLDVIMAAIESNKTLCIAYQKFTADKPDNHTFHPYLLKEYKGRWYVLGHSDARHSVITLALDRMEHITESDIPYRHNTNLKAHEYFKHTIGITHAQGAVEEIELWFTSNLGHYIKTQHLHPSQRIIRDDETGFVIELKLIINYELISLLLSYCPDIRVIKPESLRTKLNELLRKGMEVNSYSH